MARVSKMALASAMSVFLLVGCAQTYRTPEAQAMSPANVATVVSGDNKAVKLASIDGREVPHVDFRPTVRWEMSAGEHTALAALSTHRSSVAQAIPLKFAVQPGQTYFLRYKVNRDLGSMNTGTWQAWIENAAGKTVSESVANSH